MRKKLLIVIIGFMVMGFVLPDDPANLKGRLKRIDYFLSRTHDDYKYDIEGRLQYILKPYGKRINYSYHENLTFIETIDPRGFTRHDTVIKKGSNLADTVLTQKGFWLPEYDLERNLIREVYVPVKGKKRKPSTPTYTHTYSYYCDTSQLSNPFNYPCDKLSGRRYTKSHVCINDKGDTVYCFIFKYNFNESGKVSQGMKYYSTGQLYDSVGYTYY